MRTLQRLLLSRRNAVGAMALLALLLALASATPQGEDLEALRRRRPTVAWALERLHPAEVARSPVFVALVGFVAAGVLLSMVTRVRARRERPAPGTTERFVERRSLVLPVPPAEAEARAAAALREAGFPGALSGWRGGAGFWGSIAFHAGLLVTLGGIALSATGRFSGEVVLVEGFPAEVSPAMFLRADPPERLEVLRGTRLSISDVAATFADRGRLVDVSAVLHVERAGRPAERRFVSVNVPVDVAPFQLTLHAYGFAPELRAVDPSGRTRAEGTVALRVLPPGTEDSLVLDPGGQLTFRFFPDGGDGARPASASPVPARPVLEFRWYERGALVAQGRVAPGGEAVVAGYRLAFPRYVYWADLLVGRDPGLPWFTLGAILGVAGLALRLARHEQSWAAEIAPAPSGSELRLTLSARYFPGLLRERADRLAAALQE
jgi:cytochrome c biogenesis protein ResB